MSARVYQCLNCGDYFQLTITDSAWLNPEYCSDECLQEDAGIMKADAETIVVAPPSSSTIEEAQRLATAIVNATTTVNASGGFKMKLNLAPEQANENEKIEIEEK